MKNILVLLSALLFNCPATDAAGLPAGSKSLNFTVPQSAKKIQVFSYLPPEANALTPIVFVLTGLSRDADKYRDAWVENARKNKLIVIAPYFSQQDYPGSDSYNLGNIINPQTGKLNPQGEWAFTVIDGLFTEMQKQGITRQKSYYLFGNSAGCQFVHRMLTLMPATKVKAAICAAAGWWTMPNIQTPWPYGLDNAPIAVSQQQLAHYFALPVLIAVGGKDNNPNHPLLRRSPQAQAQGDSRLQRAKAYFMAAEQQARHNIMPFNWQFTILSGVAHSGSKMSAYAAQQFGWFEQHGKFKVQDD
ncbi:hypothetical protein [Yersinia proxima]|uniref:hypothetical protein n=1 Tax=Yersinia proxima TaxID=2890316 RepID=UPI001D12D912|nr:hypothetical protein [Yersinia proxima]